LETEEVYVKVAEARPQDAGRGLVRLDPLVAKDMDIRSGDVVSLAGAKGTAAIAWPGYPEDSGKKIIRADGVTRRNAGCGIDDKVKIKKVKAKHAEKLTLAPTEPLRIRGLERYLSQLLEGRVVMRGDLIEISIMGRKLELVVTAHQPAGDAVIVGSPTEVVLSEKPVKDEIKRVPAITYEDIGGLEEEVKKVREMIELPLKHPELFEHLGIEPPKGVLLYGPPGTGKTLLAKAVANEAGAHFISLNGPEIMSKYYGESEKKIREIFDEAQQNAPSIVFIDELDSIAPKREEVTGEVERRVVAQLLALMDGLKERGRVVVIGATNRPNALDPALRRGGRFDREIEIGIPDVKGRLEVLQIHTRGVPLTEDVNLEKLAEMCHGYVGADLATLTKESGMRALRRVIPEVDIETDIIPAEVLDKLNVTWGDIYAAYKELQPSAMREVLIEKPNVQWNDIGGLNDAKQELIEVVEWPLKYEKLYEHLKTRVPKGILLYGPPGTGKTLLAKAVATESESNFINVKGPEFLSKWVGESEKAVRETFRKARQAAPCVVFFDELDAITPTRGGGSGDSHVTERMISQLLTELDGLEDLKDVVVIGATNRPDIIDTALLRPGRFDRLIYVKPPSSEARKLIFDIHLRDVPLDDDVDLERLVSETEDYTGADIAGVCTDAKMLLIREVIQSGKASEEDIKQTKVQMEHFTQALQRLKPFSKSELEKYKRIAEGFRGS